MHITRAKFVCFLVAVVSITAGFGARLLGQTAPIPDVAITRDDRLAQNVWPGDFNGDGKTDLAASEMPTADGGNGRVLVALGNASGTFATPVVTTFVGHVVNVGDFNKDGKADLVVVSENGARLAILPGNGNGTFGAARTAYDQGGVTFAVGADLDGDGKRDLVVGLDGFTALVLPGRGDFTFDTAVALTTGAFPMDAIIADVNADGKKDILVANHYDSHLTLFLNQGAMLFRAVDIASGGGNDVTVGDFNRDGRIDLAVAISSGGDGDNYFESGRVAIMLGRGDGTFAAPVTYAAAPGAWQIVAGDFNRDGVTDIVTANRSSIYVDDCTGTTRGKTWDSISVFSGVGDGTLRPARTFSLGDQSDPTSTRFGNRVVSLNTNDLNADGFTDLIASFGAIILNKPASSNVAPVVDAGASYTTTIGDTILQAIASDADDDFLTWSWTDSAGFEFARWPNVCTSGGLLARGANTFRVTVSDRHGHTATDTITINYQPPADDSLIAIAAPAPGDTVIAGQPYTIRWSAPASLASEHVTFSDSLDGGTHYADIAECTNVRVDAGRCTWNAPSVPAEDVWLTAATRDGNEYATGGSGPFAIRTVSPAALPSPWLHRDVGSPGAPGNATYRNGVFTVDGSGDDVFGTVDAFHYVYQHFDGCGIGDLDAVTHVDSVENVHRWTRAGLMVRAGLGASAAHASIFITPGKGVAFQRRPLAGGTSVNTSGPLLTAPIWLRLSVRGSTVIGYYKKNAGDAWTRLDDDEITSPCAGHFSEVGLAVVSRVSDTLATAKFSSVSLAPQPAITRQQVQLPAFHFTTLQR